MVIKFRTQYMDRALFDLTEVVDEAMVKLADVEFDTFVGTGFSGGVVVPFLATMMNKNFLLIRKDDDNSHHGGGKALGTMGNSWIFVDDFSSTGATRRRVLEKLHDTCGDLGHQAQWIGSYYYVSWAPDGKQVGSFVDERDNFDSDDEHYFGGI